MIVSILGCGWYGKALAYALIKKGITVKGSATSKEKSAYLAEAGIIPCTVKFEADNENFDLEFFECDVLIISIPPKFRKGEINSYLPQIKRIINAVLQNQIKKVIYISSTGVYGNHNGEVNELSKPQPDTESGSRLLEAESFFQTETVFKTSIIRFAGLIGPGRHPGKFFVGKKDIPNGIAPVNLICLTDCIGITMAIIEKNIFGELFNACTPDHPQKSDFYTQEALKARLPIPEFINELVKWKKVNSLNIKNILNYEFTIKHLSNCIYD